MSVHNLKLSESINLETLECANCAVVFAVPVRFIAQRREDHQNFYCPSGHVNYYPYETEAEKLRKQLSDQVRAATAMAERAKRAEQKQAELEKQILATKKRHAAALCPCCNRSFVQLRRHLQTKHPEYSPAAGAK